MIEYKLLCHRLSMKNPRMRGFVLQGNTANYARLFRACAEKSGARVFRRAETEDLFVFFTAHNRQPPNKRVDVIVSNWA